MVVAVARVKVTETAVVAMVTVMVRCHGSDPTRSLDLYLVYNCCEDSISCAVY